MDTISTHCIGALWVALAVIGTARGQILNQQGDFNTATGEVGAGATFQQVQFGRHNSARIGGDNVISPNVGSEYSQTQRGDRNSAYIGETNVLTRVRQLQVGDRNRAAFETTDGTDSWFNAGRFVQRQRGDRNVLVTHAGYKQWKRSDIEQVQRGSRNVARILRTASGGEGVLDTRQVGDRNRIQFDWNHQAEGALKLRQRGDRNRLEGGFTHADQDVAVDQRGLRNTVNLQLETTSYSVDVIQEGTGNSVTVTR